MKKVGQLILIVLIGFACSSPKGMLKKGYLADMLIMENDLMAIPHDQIMKTRVDYTIVGGKVVYKRDGAE